MKKFVKAALAVALLGFSSTLFAATPVSFLKETTYNLFEDETVDNFAWGVEDADGLVLGGVNDGIDLGIGAFIGDLWWSIYDNAYINTNITTTQTVSNDAVAEDGVNTDYVDVYKKTTKNNGTNLIWNALYLSFAGDDWGVQSYWRIFNMDTGNIGKQTEEEETNTTGIKWNKEDKVSRYSGNNTFGANFKGIGASDLNDAGLYFQLNNFQVSWNNTSMKREYKRSWKQNGVSYSAAQTDDENYDSYSYKLNNNTITPSFQAEMGFDLADFGALSTKFVLKEDFDITFGAGKSTSVTTDIVEDNNSKKVTKTTTTDKDGNADYRLQFDNTITPQLVFDFDVGERVMVKGLVSAGVRVYNTPGDKNGVTTIITNSETTYKNTHLKDSYYEKFVNEGNNTTITDKFTTEVNPYTALAVVYELKPEKFNLNFGFAWNAGSLKWETTTVKNVISKDTYYRTDTDTAGEKVVTADTVTYTRRDTAADQAANAVAESKTTVYTASFTGTPRFSIGANWFLNDKVQLDMAYDTAIAFDDFRIMNDGTNAGLLDSTFKIQLSVKF